MVVTVAAQINLIMLISELFKEFYAPTHHSESAYYLYFGLHGKSKLVPWIWTAISMNVIASGGFSQVQDIIMLNKLNKKNITGVVVGKALYTGDIRLEQAISSVKP